MVVGSRDPSRRDTHRWLCVARDRARAHAGAAALGPAQARVALSGSSRARARPMLAVARAHTLGKLPAAFAGYILEFAHSQRAFGLALGDPWRRRAGDLARARSEERRVGKEGRYRVA